MEAIVYESNTGFTRRYAKMLSEATGLPCYKRKWAWLKVPKGADIIFMSWLIGNNIKKYKAVDRWYTIKAVATVGMFIPTPAVKAAVTQCHNIPPEQEVFCLRGGFNMKKLRGIYRAFAKSAVSHYRITASQSQPMTSNDRALAEFMTRGGDFVKKENLEPIIQWYNNGCKMPEPEEVPAEDAAAPVADTPAAEEAADMAAEHTAEEAEAPADAAAKEEETADMAE